MPADDHDLLLSVPDIPEKDPLFEYPWHDEHIALQRIVFDLRLPVRIRDRKTGRCWLVATDFGIRI